MQEQGDNFPNWVLDQLGIETELANRVAMGRGLQPPRFRWVPFDDALMYPLKNSALASESPDRKFFFQRESMLLRSYLKDVGRDLPPATLQEYVSRVVTPVLEMQKKNGAVAIKFEAAYLRSLDFGAAEPMQSVQQVYAHFIKGDVPSHTTTLGCRTFFSATLRVKPGASACRYTSIPAAAAAPISC